MSKFIMIIISWNVNSIRSRLDATKKVIAELKPDILCLQETKVTDDLYPHQFFKSLGFSYNIARGQSAYNGVAIASKVPLSSAETFSINHETRHLAVRIKDVTIHNLYIPAGGDIPDVDTNKKFADKLDYIDKLGKWFKQQHKKDDKVIALGDLNIAPLENDVWSHKQLLKVVSHTPIEVEKYGNLIKSLDFFDGHRQFISPEQKLYSWWSYRNRDWKKSNRGRRLDHILLTQSLKQNLLGVRIFQNARDYEKPSDHVPVSIDIDI